MDTEKLIRPWMKSRKGFTKARIAVAEKLAKGSVTQLLDFVYHLQLEWDAAGRGGFNHEIDELAVLLEPDSQLYYAKWKKPAKRKARQAE